MLRKFLLSTLVVISTLSFVGASFAEIGLRDGRQAEDARDIFSLPVQIPGVILEPQVPGLFGPPPLEEEQVMPTIDDHWVPWPWKLAQPIPWADIQGLWKVQQGEFTSYFALKVVTNKGTGIRQLQVKQFDGATCRVLSTGVGLERNSKILAQMTSRGGITYRVQLTAFDEKDLPPSLPPVRGNFPIESVMVLSMGTLDNIEPEDMVHMQIVKVSRLLTQKMCFEDVKR